VEKMTSKLSLKKIFKWNLLEFFLIFLAVTLSAIGGYLISIRQWLFVIVAFLFSFIIHFMLSKRKQNKILYGTSRTPGPATNFPKGTIYMRHKD